MASLKSFFVKQWHLIAFVAGLVLFLWILWKLAEVVLPFLVGLILAYLLIPIVRWLEKRLPGKKRPKAKRISIILGIYMVALILFSGFVAYMIVSVGASFAGLIQGAPKFASQAMATIQEWLDGFRRQLPEVLQVQMQSIFGDLGTMFGNALKEGLFKGVSAVTASASMVFGFISLPIFLFFVLADWEDIRDKFFGWMAPWAQEHARGVAGIIDRVLGHYFRGQLIMGGIIAVLVFAMLQVLGIQFAPALGVLAGMMEMVPLLGVWISAGTGVVVALATAPDKAIWVLIGYLVIQQIENNVMVPKIQGSVLRLHPAALIVIGVLAAYIGGILGFIIGIPLAATFFEIIRYIRNAANRASQETAGKAKAAD